MEKRAGVNYEGRVPKTLRDWVNRNAADKVYEVSYGGGFTTDSGNAYDVGIRAGWVIDYYGDRSHTLIEPTVRAVIDRLRTLRRCEEDDECREAWGLR